MLLELSLVLLELSLVSLCFLIRIEGNQNSGFSLLNVKFFPRLDNSTQSDHSQSCGSGPDLDQVSLTGVHKTHYYNVHVSPWYELHHVHGLV